jgi:hypothetical protein
MRHLFSSKVMVLELTETFQYGSATEAFTRRTEILDPYTNEPGMMWCRIDLGFVRPGKETLLANEKGVFEDRVGVLFAEYTPYLDIGNRVVCLSGPVEGTFEIKAKPDAIQNYNRIHHLECSVQEVAQSVAMHYTPPEVS